MSRPQVAAGPAAHLPSPGVHQAVEEPHLGDSATAGSARAGIGINPALFWHKRDGEMVLFKHFLTLQGFAVPRLDCSFYFVNAFLLQSAPPRGFW